MTQGTVTTGRDSVGSESRPPNSPQPPDRGRSQRWLRRVTVALLLLFIALGLFAVSVHVWAEYHFRLAEREIQRVQLIRARRHIDKCLQIWPQSYRVNFLAARLSRRLGDLDQAEKHLQICQNLAGHREEIFLERLLIRAQSGEPDAVLPALRDLVQKNHPDSNLILESLARGYAMLFRFADLDIVLHQWLEREPDSLVALVFRAWAHEQLGARHDALQDYRAILEKDPGNDEARLRLASLLIEKSQPEEAHEHLQIIVRRHPDNLVAKVRLALSLHDMGHIEEADRYLHDVLEAEPNSAAALTARGRIALQMNRVEEAAAFLRRSLEVDKTDYTTTFLLHQALERLGDQSEEFAEITKRLRSLEADTRRLHTLIIEQNAALAHDPAVHVEIAAILFRAGDKQEGLRWIQQALRLDPQFPKAHAELAKYYQAQGDAMRAQHHRRLAGEFAPR